MLLPNKDIGYCGLAGHLSQGSLDCAAIINFVEFDGVVFGTQLVEKGLGGVAVWAVRFAEDGNSILINNALGLGLCGRHDGWVDGCGGEESA